MLTPTSAASGNQADAAIKINASDMQLRAEWLAQSNPTGNAGAS